MIECIGCNQACIGHYHAGVADRLRRQRPHRPGADARRRQRPRGPAPPGRVRRLLVIGAGPAGAAAAIEAARTGDDVTLVEREPELGGQLRLAGLAPAHIELWERYRRSTTARLRAAGVTLTLNTEADAALAAGYDAVVLAAGARPYLPTMPATVLPIVLAWDAIRAPEDVAGPVLVADWGGGWDGLDAAERVAGAGHDVTLACAGLVPGETLHQYQRNLYLGRLDEQSIAILHHHELALEGDAIQLRHVFSGATRPLPETATLVLAQGRAPADELWAELESHPSAVRAGDVLGPAHAGGGGARGHPRHRRTHRDGRRGRAGGLMAKRIGGHLVAESLAALGAEAAFGVPGIHALAIWEGAARRGRAGSISVYGTRTELPPASPPTATPAAAGTRRRCCSPPGPAR